VIRLYSAKRKNKVDVESHLETHSERNLRIKTEEHHCMSAPWTA